MISSTYVKLQCGKCAKVVAVLSYYPPELESIVILCITCNEQLLKVERERELTGAEPRYRCRACHDFEAESQTDIYMHVLDSHKEIPFRDILTYIETIR